MNAQTTNERTTPRRVFSAVVAVALTVPFDGFACSCEPPPPPREALKLSVTVFFGTVSQIDAFG